jgi:hypothetical protein
VTIVWCVFVMRNDDEPSDKTGCIRNRVKRVNLVKFCSSSTVHVRGSGLCDMLRCKLLHWN